MQATHRVALPALDGRDPLGFLTALGTLRLLADETGLPARLSFDTTTATALLHSPLTDTHHIAEALRDILDAIPDDGVLPGVPTDFPRPKHGTGPDPMRVPRHQFPTLIAQTAGNPTTLRWLTALLTDLATDNQGRVAITPYCAPSGQQSIRTFFTNPLHAIRADPDRIHQALTSWQRLNGFTGEYLDHRVLASAADHPTGKSTESGVPGATWLATMALPLLPITGDGHTVQATGWRTIPGRTTPIMIWPLWHQPLTPPAIQTLLEHPTLQPTHTNNHLTINPHPLPELGIFHTAAADRQPVQGRKFAGALAPHPIHTQPPPTNT